MRWLLRILGAVGILAAPLALSQLPPVRAGLVWVATLLGEGTALGVAVFAVAHALGCVATVPIWIFTGIAGYVCGPVRGVLIASPANALAMTTAFLFGRFALSGRLRAWIGASPRWEAIHRAVTADALRMGLLLRVSPLAPQNLLSYAFSLTRMRLRTYVAVTWVGMFPVVCVQVYLGSLLHDLADVLAGKRPPLGPWGWAAPAAAIVVTVSAMGTVTILGRRALRRAGV
jgi:uncharacterized membrane protein YdjX (TVP38/TMEM64 family)